MADGLSGRPARAQPRGDPRCSDCAFREVEPELSQNPHIWHKGRDRARVVLGVVRDELPATRRGSFPVDLSRIVTDALPERIADLGLAIPDEVRKLLDAMVRA